MLPENIVGTFSSIPARVIPDREDLWCWNYSEEGRYSVRDGYLWLREKGVTMDGGFDGSWIWKLDVPEKVRMFVWLGLHEVLPVNQLCFCCRMAKSSECSQCRMGPEDGIHCLRDCPLSREIWTRVGVGIWPNFWSLEMHDWITIHARGNQPLKFLSALWGVWKWRCNAVLVQHPWTVHEAWSKERHDHDEFLKFNSSGSGEAGNLLQPVWQPPPVQAVKLNTDGSYQPEDGSMGGRGLICDSDGSWQVGFMWNGTASTVFRRRHMR